MAATAREQLEAIADAACPEQEAQARIYAFAAEVRATALHQAADLAEKIGSRYLDHALSGEGNGAMGVAAALRAFADTPMPAPCPQHPAAPVIAGVCGGCTQYPADMRPDAEPARNAAQEPTP